MITILTIDLIFFFIISNIIVAEEYKKKTIIICLIIEAFIIAVTYLIYSSDIFMTYYEDEIIIKKFLYLGGILIIYPLLIFSPIAIIIIPTQFLFIKLVRLLLTPVLKKLARKKVEKAKEIIKSTNSDYLSEIAFGKNEYARKIISDKDYL